MNFTLKKILLALCAVPMLALAQPAAEELPGTLETDVAIRELYVPKGFDSNDNSEVVVAGYLPNLCYRSPRVELKREGDRFIIKAKATLLTKSLLCPLVIVPFHVSVPLGVLPPGNYAIEAHGAQVLKKSLGVAEARSNAVDDFIYAQVSYVETDPLSNKVIIHAYNPSECLKFSKAKFIMNDEGNVLSILPIMKRGSDHCPMKMVPLRIPIQLTDEQAKENLLLHVRSMDGRSSNAVFHFVP